MVTEEHITAFGWASYQEIDEILNLSLRINDYLSGLFTGVGLKLVDFKVEFGRLWEEEEMRIAMSAMSFISSWLAQPKQAICSSAIIGSPSASSL